MSSSGETVSRTEAAKNFFSKTSVIYVFNFIQNLVLAAVVTAVYTSIMAKTGQDPTTPPPIELLSMTNFTNDQVIDALTFQTALLDRAPILIMQPDGMKAGYDIDILRKFLDSIGPIDVSYRLEAFDCDDFAYVLMGKEREWFGLNSPQSVAGSTFSWISGDLRLHGENQTVGHAMNLFIDNYSQVWLIEPQTFEIFRASQLSDKSVIDFILM